MITNSQHKNTPSRHFLEIFLYMYLQSENQFTQGGKGGFYSDCVNSILVYFAIALSALFNNPSIVYQLLFLINKSLNRT